MDAKLSPFIQNIPESTSPSGSHTKEKEIGSDTVVIERDTATQSEDNFYDTKFNKMKEHILIKKEDYEAVEKHNQDFGNQSERGFKGPSGSNNKHDFNYKGRSERHKSDYYDIGRKKTLSKCIECVSIKNPSCTMDVKLSPFIRNVPGATSPRKYLTRDIEAGSKSVIIAKDMTTQSHIVDDMTALKQQYKLNKEGDYEALEKHNQYFENNLDRGYTHFLPASSKKHESKNDQSNKSNLDNKCPSVFTRKFKALGRGLVKKMESKSKTNNTLGEVTRRWGIYIASDPPSEVSKPQSFISNPFRDVPKKNDNNNAKKNVLRDEKEKKKLFSFRKKNKYKDIDKGQIIFKNSFTAGRCEVMNRLMIRNKSNDHMQNANAIVERKEKLLKDSSIMCKNNVKETQFHKIPAHIDSRKSIKVIWNNKIYTTSSSTVSELMNNIYRDSSIVLKSKSKVTQRQIEAWLVLKTNDLQFKKHKLDKTNEKCMEVRVFDEKWVIDKSKAFSHEIEIILHSNKLASKGFKQDSSECIRIDIPKGFFIDSKETSCKNNNNSVQDQSSAEEVYKITEYDTENYGKKEKNICKSCKKVHKQNSVNVNEQFENDNLARNLEKSEIPTIRRDTVVQGSHVFKSRHDFVGVGIVNRRDNCELSNPGLTQYDGFSEEESEQDVQRRERCKFAENYLLDYYGSEIPGIDLIILSDDYRLQYCSDNSLDSYLYCNQNETQSCPIVFDKSRQVTSFFEIEHISMRSLVQSCCWFEKLKQACCDVKNDISEKYRKEADTNIGNRIQPKDSIKVYNSRKLYATSNKSKWKVVRLESPSCAEVCDESKVDGSRGSNDTKCNEQKKHVCLPDSQDFIAKASVERVPEGILTFKNNPPCPLKKQEHCKINPIPLLEPPSCRSTCEQMANPPCSNSKTSCEEMLLSKCCGKSSKENPPCNPPQYPDPSSECPAACKPQAYSTPCNPELRPITSSGCNLQLCSVVNKGCKPKTDATECLDMLQPLSVEAPPCSSCDPSNATTKCPAAVLSSQQSCPAVSTPCSSRPCPSTRLPCDTPTCSTAPINCNQQPCLLQQLPCNRQPNLSTCQSPADEKHSYAPCAELISSQEKLPYCALPPISAEMSPCGNASSCEKTPIRPKCSSCEKAASLEKASTCEKYPSCQNDPNCGNASPCIKTFCPEKKFTCDELPSCVKAIACKKPLPHEELPLGKELASCQKVPASAELPPSEDLSPCEDIPRSKEFLCKELPPSEDPPTCEVIPPGEEHPTCEELPLCTELPICTKLPPCEENPPCEKRALCEEFPRRVEICPHEDIFKPPPSLCKTPESIHDKTLSSTTCKFPPPIPCNTSPTTLSKSSASATCKIPCVISSGLSNKMPSCIPCKTISYTPSKTSSSIPYSPSLTPCRLPSTPCKKPSPMPCKMPSPTPWKMPSPMPCKMPSPMPCKMPSPRPFKMPSSIPCKVPSCKPSETISNVPWYDPSKDPSLRPCHKQMSITSQKPSSKAFSEFPNINKKPCLKPCTPRPPPCKHILLPHPCTTYCDRYPCSQRFQGVQIRGFPSIKRYSISNSSDVGPDTFEPCPDGTDICDQSCRPCYFTTKPTPYISDQCQDPEDVCPYVAQCPTQHISDQSQVTSSPSCLQCTVAPPNVLESCHNYPLATPYFYPSPKFSCAPTECPHNPLCVKGKCVSVSANIPITYPLRSPSNSAAFISNHAHCLGTDPSYNNQNIESSIAAHISSPSIISTCQTPNPSKSSCKQTLCASSQTGTQSGVPGYEHSTGKTGMHSNSLANEASTPCKSFSTRSNTKRFNIPFCYKKNIPHNLLPPFKKHSCLQCRKHNEMDLTKEESVLDADRYIDAEQNWIKCESDCAMKEHCRKSCENIPSSPTVHELKSVGSSPRSEAISELNSDPGCSPLSLYPLSPPISPNSMKLTGVHIRVLPSSKKICSADCPIWAPPRRDDTLALNAEEKIIIRFRKDNASNDDLTDGLNIKVQDENGITLFEMKEKENYKKTPVCNKNNGLFKEIYKESHLNRLATTLDGDCDHKILEQKDNTNTIEIRIKLQVSKGDQTTEDYKSCTEIKGDRKTNDKPISRDVFEDKDREKSSDEYKNDNDDVIIRIIVKKSKSNTKEVLLSKQDYNKRKSEQNSSKFHSVSTGYSDIIQEDVKQIFSMHRTAVNLTSVEKIDSEEVIRNVILTPDTNGNKTKLSTESYICIIDNKSSKIETQSIIKTDINQPTLTQTLINEKVRVNIERQESSTLTITISDITDKEKQEIGNKNLIEQKCDPVATANIEFPDIILEILENHYTHYMKQKSGSEETTKERRMKDQKKQLLKNVFEKAQKAKRNKKRMKKLRDMLRFILSYDSSDPDETNSSSTTNKDLERKGTCTSLKPNYLTYSGSMNNFYRAEVSSSHTVISDKTLCEQEMYPTSDITVCSRLNSSENTHSELPCMCSTVAKNMKLASWIGKMGGACYCRKPIIKTKKSVETVCDLDNPGYFNVDYVDIETQNSRNVVSKVTSTNISYNSSVFTLPGNINETFDLHEVCTSYNKHLETCVNHVKRCGKQNIDGTTFGDKNNTVFLSTKSIKASGEVESIKDRQNKERKFVAESDILQSNAIKKAVLEIYTEQITANGRMVAKLPKFVYDTEYKLRSNFNAIAANTHINVNICK